MYHEFDINLTSFHFIFVNLEPFLAFLRRYSDILVHRLLAVAIGALDSYPDLLSKDKTQVGVSDQFVCCLALGSKLGSISRSLEKETGNERAV